MIGGFILTLIAAIASYLGTAVGVGELKSKLVTRTDNNAAAVIDLEADVTQLKINDANCERRLSVIDNNISNLQGQGNEITKISEKQIALAVELGRLQADVKNVGNTLSNLKQDLRVDFKELGDKIDKSEKH